MNLNYSKSTTMAKRRSTRSFNQLIYGCSSLVLWGLLEMSVGTLPSLSQRSIPRPNPEIQPIPDAPPTFEPEDIPPRSYSPPVYEEDSKQFQLYRLDIGDAVSVSVPQFPEFSTSSAIDPEGNIQIPIVGRVAVKGLTLDEVETKVRYELGRRFLREEPDVVAVLAAPRPVQLTILGEVVRPGFFTVAPNSDLTAVITGAGGSTARADLRSVIVRRPLVDGTVLEQKVDLYSPLLKGKSAPDFRLQGGDTVILTRLEVGQEKDYDRYLVSRTSLTQQTMTVRVLVPLLPSGTALRNINLPSGSTFLDVIASLPTTDRLRINITEVSLLRFDQEKRGVVTQTVNPQAAIRGDISQNFPLEDQDVIIVSRTLLGKVFAAFNIITQPVRDLRSFTNTITDFADGDFFDNGGNNNRNRNNR
jgi:polysaccharide export outer membrane protein